MSSVGNFFGHLHPSTKGLSSDILDKTTELVFSFRDGVESVCWITNDKDIFKSVAGEVPDVVYNADTDRYAVDLDSIGTSQVRMYVGSNNTEDGISGYGYYMSSTGNIVEKKVYKVADAYDPILIDRYDVNGVLISENEKELIADKGEWFGNKSLVDDINEICLKALRDHDKTFGISYTKKEEKNQSYIRVFS